MKIKLSSRGHRYTGQTTASLVNKKVLHFNVIHHVVPHLTFSVIFSATIICSLKAVYKYTSHQSHKETDIVSRRSTETQQLKEKVSNIRMPAKKHSCLVNHEMLLTVTI